MNNRPTLFRLAPVFALCALAAILLSACGGKSTIAKPKKLTELPGSAYSMQVLWHTGTGDGAGPYDDGFQPFVTQNRVYVANRDGTVVALNLANGNRIWRAHTGEALVSGPTVSNGTLLVGTRNGKIVALATDSGKREWDADLGSEVIAPLAADQQTAVARTVDGHVVAMALDSGNRIWAVDDTVPKLTLHGTASPVIDGNVVYDGMDSGKILALDLATGEQRWQQTVALPDGRSELDRIVDVDATPLISGNLMYAVSTGKSMVAMSLNGGQINWKADISAESGLALDDSHVYTSDLDSTVWGVNRDNGEVVWKQNALGYRKLSGPAAYNGNVVVGDYEGYLHELSASNGKIVARGRPFKEAILAAPVVVGDRLIVLGADGDVAAVRFGGTR